MALRTFLTTIALLIVFSCYSQEMWLQSQKYHHKWRSTIGVGGAEPVAVHLQLYRGFSCKSLRGWLLEAKVGMEGMVYDVSKTPLLGGQWRKGAIRYSFAYNRRILRGINEYLPWLGFLTGFGIQSGYRNYLDENSVERNYYAIGPQFNFNIETYIIDKRINRDQYLGVVLFAEYLYHREFTANFEISRINGGLRLNFYN